jgi:hypothetical protein
VIAIEYRTLLPEDGLMTGDQRLREFGGCRPAVAVGLTAHTCS